MHEPRDHGTFSIVACDPDRSYWGVAVATRPPSVGAIVPWAQWRAGALATQAMANVTFGPNGLRLLARGAPAEEAVRRLVRADPGRDHRQLGVVDRRGGVAAWTGRKCMPHASHLTGDGFSCQGNLLAAATVVPAMARAFEASHGTLASRMLRALRAGAAEGGDRRGMSSSALVVVHRERWMPRIWSDYWVNLRVDRHRTPIPELGRLLRADEADTRKYLARRARDARQRSKRRG